MEPNDNLDQWLDRALDQYSNVEPRPGLELRVLASVRAEREALAKRRRWTWSLAFASACAAMLIAFWLGASGKRERSPVADHSSPSVGLTQHPMDSPTVRSATNRHSNVNIASNVVRNAPAPRPVMQAHKLSGRPRTNQGIRDLRTFNGPKLEQFPSARPLSPQELAFAGYAQRFPREAMLIQQEQRNFDEEKQRAERDARNGFAAPDEER